MLLIEKESWKREVRVTLARFSVKEHATQLFACLEDCGERSPARILEHGATWVQAGVAELPCGRSMRDR